jgi:hypothetical protein
VAGQDFFSALPFHLFASSGEKEKMDGENL